MTSEDSNVLVLEQLAEEFAKRLRAGEPASMEEFIRRCPEAERQIRELFPAIAMMERMAAGTSRDTDLAGTPAIGVSAAAECPRQRLGDYRIVREIGRGGMGVVYEAEHMSLGRRVALKVLAPHRWSSPVQQQRFAREAQAAARLHHTNIVPVFGIGREGEVDYYVMQYIDGLGLDDVIDGLRQWDGDPESDAEPDRPLGSKEHESPAAISSREVARSLLGTDFSKRGDLTVAEVSGAGGRAAGDSSEEYDGQESGADSVPNAMRARRSSSRVSGRIHVRNVAHIGRQVALALAYAHRQGVLHRDIKPANILLDRHGNAWVTDFGLAKTEDHVDLTRTGDALGTLRYMAPEVFEGQAGARSEVYALGLTLYEMLALRPAFSETDPHRLVRRICHESPPRLKSCGLHLPRDLVTIVEKAIDRDPAGRYQTARAMADDLQRFLDGHPIAARPVSTMEWTWRWARRHPAKAALAVSLAAVVLFAVGLGVSVAYQRQLQTSYGALQDSNQQLSTSQDRLRQALRRESEANQELKLSKTRVEEANQRLDAGLQRETELNANLREASEKLQRLLYLRRISRAHQNWLDADVAAALEELESCPPEYRNWEWHYLHRLCTGGDRVLNAEAGRVPSVAFSPDGQRIACAHSSDVVSVWDVATSRRLRDMRVPRRFMSRVTWSPDGRFIAAGATDGTIYLWDLKGGKGIRTLRGHARQVTSLTFRADSRQFISSSADGTMRIWSLEDPARPREFKVGRYGLEAMALHPDDERLVLGFTLGELTFWDISGDGGEAATHREPSRSIQCLAYSPDGIRLVGGTEEGVTHVWDGETGKQTLSIEDNNQAINDVAFSRDGAMIITAGQDGMVRTYQAGTGQVIQTFRGHRGAVTSLSVSADGKTIASGGADGTVRLWNMEVDPERITLSAASMAAYDLSFLPDGRRVITGSVDGHIRVWDLPLGRVLQVFRHDTSVHRVAYDADNQAVVAVSAHSARRWNLSDGKETEVSGPASLGATAADIRGDCDRMAIVYYDQEEKDREKVRVQSIRSGELLATTTGRDVALFSPDGKRLAVGILKGLRLVDVATGQVLFEHERVPQGIPTTRGLAFTPDGRFLAAAFDSGVHIHDAESGEVIRSIQHPSASFCKVAFAPCGRLLVTGDTGGAIRLWYWQDGEHVMTLPAHRGSVQAIRFSPDGGFLASVGDDGKAFFWDGRPE